MFSRISSQFVRIVRDRDPPTRSLRSLPLPFLRFAFFFFFFGAGYAERVRVRTRIELDAALLNTQCDLFETRRIKHKGPRMIGKLLRRTGFVGQSRSALK